MSPTTFPNTSVLVAENFLKNNNDSPSWLCAAFLGQWVILLLQFSTAAVVLCVVSVLHDASVVLFCLLCAEGLAFRVGCNESLSFFLVS